MTPESLYKHQQADPEIKKYVEFVQKSGSGPPGALLIESRILKRKLKSGLSVIIVPLLLVPFVLAEAHWMSHSGAKKTRKYYKTAVLVETHVTRYCRICQGMHFV